MKLKIQKFDEAGSAKNVEIWHKVQTNTETKSHIYRLYYRGVIRITDMRKGANSRPQFAVIFGKKCGHFGKTALKQKFSLNWMDKYIKFVVKCQKHPIFITNLYFWFFL